jgi:hypothetical protein
MAGVREERMDWNGIMKNTLMADPAKIVMDLCVVCHVSTLCFGFIIEPLVLVVSILEMCSMVCMMIKHCLLVKFLCVILARFLYSYTNHHFALPLLYKDAFSQ